MSIISQKPSIYRTICLLAVLVVSLLLVACGEGSSGVGVTAAAPASSSDLSSTATPALPALSPGQTPKAKVGNPAPDFRATAVDGSSVQISALRGKAVLLNYWGVYCSPCREEVPDLVKVYAAHQDKLAIVGVDINDSPQDVQNFIKEFKMPYPVVIDNTGDLVFKYRVPGQPTSIFINKDGIITGIVPGLASLDVIEQQLGKALS